jgi:hypothetical protein
MNPATRQITDVCHRQTSELPERISAVLSMGELISHVECDILSSCAAAASWPVPADPDRTEQVPMGVADQQRLRVK